MRMLLQRVKHASVTVDEQIISATQNGWLILLGISDSDNESLIEPMCKKAANLRAFKDEQEKMNLSILDCKGEILLVSQFTLYGDVKKGRRPSFTKAADPEVAESLYEKVAAEFKLKWNIPVKTGAFGAYMKVELLNDGPVTFLLDSKELGFTES